MPQLTNASIASECERIGKHLTACGAASSEIIRIQIGIEETLLRYREAFGDTAEFKIDFGKRLGRISVQLTVPGPMQDASVKYRL